MSDRYVLAIDHGTSGCKTALVSTRGAIAGGEFEPCPTHYLPGGGVEQDPQDWWRALLASSRRLIARGLVPVESIVAVACSSTFSSTVATKASGQPVAPCLTWMDARGAPHVQKAMRGLVNFQGYSLPNLARWVPRTGGAPTLSGKDDIAHVLYWKHDVPDVYREADFFLESKDWLNLRLTGRCAASFDSTTLFWATDTRDIHHVRWDDGLLQRLGVDRAKLPELLRSTDILGPLLDDVADALGVARALPVVVGSPDLQSACIGSGAVRDFEAHLYVGTSTWILCHVPFRKTDALHAIASLPSAIPGRYFAANEQDMAGGCLEFAIRTLLYPQSELRPEPPPPDLHARIDAAIAKVPAGARGVLFAPWLNGEKTPVDDESLRAGFHNLAVGTTLDDMLRAIYEGVALNARWLLLHTEKFAGRRLEPINIIGGGAQSDIWCQIYADVLGRTVRRVEQPRQANARGAAFLAAVALGDITFADIPGLTRFDRVFEPNLQHKALYDKHFAGYLDLWKRTRGWHRRWRHAPATDPAGQAGHLTP